MNRYEEADPLVREIKGFDIELGVEFIQFSVSDNNTMLTVNTLITDKGMPEARRIAYTELLDDMELRGIKYKDLVVVPYTQEPVK